MLQEKDLGRASLVGEVGLRLLAFPAPKRRIGQDNIELLQCALIQPAIGFVPCERVSVPQMRRINAMQNQIGKRNRVNQVFFLASVECMMFKIIEVDWVEIIS